MTALETLYHELALVEEQLQANAAKRPARREEITAREEQLLARRKRVEDGSRAARKLDVQLTELTNAWNQLNDEDEADFDEG